MKSTIKDFLLFAVVIFLWILASSQVGDVGDPQFNRIVFERCDATPTDTTQFLEITVTFWHRGTLYSRTQNKQNDGITDYNVTGTIINCVGDDSDDGGEVDVISCPWLTEDGRGWVLEDESDYWQREVCQ